MSQSGRPVSGFVRPGTQSGRPGTMEQAIRTPRTAQTARYGILYIEQKLGKLKCKSQLKAFGKTSVCSIFWCFLQVLETI